jgi:imidazolonepropionase-like amidohydrolase
LRTQGTAWDTLQGGFTTVQSIGAASDKQLRDLINEGAVAGPRILTSLATLNERSGAPEKIRAKVRELKAQGADVVKLFATASSRDGGKQTMTDEQIEAACSEAKRLGLRAAVHAHAAGGARPAVLSGCTSIEHGTFLTDEALDLMAQRGVYLDTNLSNVYNYIEQKKARAGQFHRRGLRRDGQRRPRSNRHAAPIRPPNPSDSAALDVALTMASMAGWPPSRTR